MNVKQQQVLQAAQSLFNQQPDWVTFFRQVMGVQGIVRQAYTTPEALEQFEQTEEYDEIQRMVTKLRERTGDSSSTKEPTRVITVRLPQSLHESLRVEAEEQGTSINKLCISKLLQIIDADKVPHDGAPTKKSAPATPATPAAEPAMAAAM